jgi:hypothetical protein
MSYNPQNPNGSATSANSSPVVIASDQAAFPIKNQDGSGNSLTSTGNALDVNLKTSGLSNFSSNIAQINGVTPLMGNGVTGTGSLRVTIASDTTSNSNAFLVAGNKTNNNAAPAATQIGVMPAVANAAVQTWTEGDQVLQSTDLSGNQRVTMGTALSQAIDSILSYPFGHTYATITTATTTTVKSGAGTLRSIIVTGGTAGTIAITDNTTSGGTSIASFDSTNAIATYTFDAAFSTGLTIVTGAATKITVVYR